MRSGDRDLHDRLFWVAREDEIKRADTTDIYFIHTLDVLRGRGMEPEVVVEVYTRKVPYSDNWGLVTGIYEVAKLLEGLPVDVTAMEEGEVFLTDPTSAIYEPVMQIEGKYTDFLLHENPILGLICCSTSVSTRAARVKMAAGEKPVFSFGSRRTHPAIAPTVERASYIGGFDSVSNVLASKLMGTGAVGTMPHTLIQCFGDPREAWKAFDEIVPSGVPRIALVDTFSDEKTETVLALETLGERLTGVRLDTPSSRRGDWKKIIEEVRWELGVRGASQVKIIASGGLNEGMVASLSGLVDGFGVGTSVSAPPVIDFNAKIVEIREKGRAVYRAKRGDIAGRKQVYRQTGTLDDFVTLARNEAPQGREPLLTPLMEAGRILRPFRNLDDIRSEVLGRLKLIQTSSLKLAWSHASKPVIT